MDSPSLVVLILNSQYRFSFINVSSFAIYLAAKYNIIDITRYAVAINNQMSRDSGCMNDNRSGGSLAALLYRMLIPTIREN